MDELNRPDLLRRRDPRKYCGQRPRPQASLFQRIEPGAASGSSTPRRTGLYIIVRGDGVQWTAKSSPSASSVILPDARRNRPGPMVMICVQQSRFVRIVHADDGVSSTPGSCGRCENEGAGLNDRPFVY